MCETISTENRENREKIGDDVAKLLIAAYLDENPSVIDFFTFYLVEEKCCQCNDSFFVLRKTNKNKLWCIHCFVKKHCNVTKDEDGCIIALKRNSTIIYSSCPIRNIMIRSKKG